MSGTGTITLLIILANIILSYRGFQNEAFFGRLVFGVDKILLQKDYKRLITSGFVHVGWGHLIFNMLSLFFFSGSVEFFLGPVNYLVIYFASLIGGNLLSLFIHRHHGDYTAAGASGAVCGVIFASIALVPDGSIYLFFFPMPAWLYGLLYVLFSIYGIRSRNDNIGHDAHLGGALIGLIVAIIMHPSSLADNYLTILVILIPSLFFIYMIISKPHFLLVDNYFFRTHKGNYTIDQRYNAEKAIRQQEVDRILEKIHKRGIKSLNQKEKEILEEYSKKS